MFEVTDHGTPGTPTTPSAGPGGACAVPDLDVARVRRMTALVGNAARATSAIDSDAPCEVSADAERVDLIRALEELKAAAAAAQVRATDDLARSTRVRRARQGLPARERSRGVGTEVALSRRESPNSGGRFVGFAAVVREMPHAFAGLATGWLSEWRATVVVREVVCLDREDRLRVDAELFADPAHTRGWGVQRLAAEARRLAALVDPEAVVARARRAFSERRVTCRPAPDTMAYLTALLPADQAVGAYARLLRAADSARATGDPRSRGQVMADALVEAVRGHGAGGRGSAGADPDADAADADAAATSADSAAAANPAAEPVELQLVISDASLFGSSEEPGELAGYGPVPAGWARDLVHRGLAEAAVWVRRLYADRHTGALTAMESRSRLAPAGLARFVRSRDRTCRTPYCDAPIRHTDHVTSYANGGGTSAENLQGLCEQCNYVKEAAGWSSRTVADAPAPPGGRGRHTVEITTPTGHRYRSTAPAAESCLPPEIGRMARAPGVRRRQGAA
jgi:hypothetical protein